MFFCRWQWVQKKNLQQCAKIRGQKCRMWKICRRQMLKVLTIPTAQDSKICWIHGRQDWMQLLWVWFKYNHEWIGNSEFVKSYSLVGNIWNLEEIRGKKWSVPKVPVLARKLGNMAQNSFILWQQLLIESLIWNKLAWCWQWQQKKSTTKDALM